MLGEFISSSVTIFLKYFKIKINLLKSEGDSTRMIRPRIQENIFKETTVSVPKISGPKAEEHIIVILKKFYGKCR